MSHHHDSGTGIAINGVMRHSRRRVLLALRQVHRLALKSLYLSEIQMATIAELNTEIESLNDAIVADEAQDDKNEADLNAVIVDLRAQIAAGTTDFAPQIARLEAIKGNLHAPVVP